MYNTIAGLNVRQYGFGLLQIAIATQDEVAVGKAGDRNAPAAKRNYFIFPDFGCKSSAIRHNVVEQYGLYDIFWYCTNILGFVQRNA